MNLTICSVLLITCLLAMSGHCARQKRAAVGPFWPTNKLAYQFDKDFKSEKARKMIRSALVTMEKQLEVNGQKCLEFAETNEETEHILFGMKDDKECSSMVGYQEEGAHFVNLAESCWTPGKIIRQVLHRLGFDNELTRHDRDKYVEINKDNLGMNEFYESHFETLSNEANTYQVPYDYFSLSHRELEFVNQSEPGLSSRFPSLTKQFWIDKSDTLSPFDILQIQRAYKCQESAAPAVRGSVRIKANKRWKVGLKFLSEAAMAKDFNMSVAELYLKRTMATCGHSHFWPLKYPLIDNYDEHYARVCVEKRALSESCQFSIECESGVCHEGQCSTNGYQEAIRLENHYAGPLNVASPDKCYAQCLMDETCDAASFHSVNQTCYLFIEGHYTAYRDPEYVSIGLTDKSLLENVAYVIQEGARLVDPFKTAKNIKSPLQCFRECTKEAKCVASSFSESDGQQCLLFASGDHQMHKDSAYVTYMAN